MLFISSRKDLSNEDAIGPDEFWDLKIPRGMVTGRRRLSGLSDIQKAVAGKRVLILVHGYNNEFEDITRAYNLIEGKISRFMKNKYDVVIGFLGQVETAGSSTFRQRLGLGRFLHVLGKTSANSTRRTLDQSP